MEQPINQRTKVCCFCGKDNNAKELPTLRLIIIPPPDRNDVIIWAHPQCFNQLHNPSILPFNSEELGHVPRNAKCAFCGTKPRAFGRHPYLFDVGEASPSNRFLSHKKCLLERIQPFLRAELE